MRVPTGFLSPNPNPPPFDTETDSDPDPELEPVRKGCRLLFPLLPIPIRELAQRRRGAVVELAWRRVNAQLPAFGEIK